MADAGSIMSGIAAVGDTVSGVVNNIQNYKLQRSWNRYQKNLQKVIFAREDNAVQRRTADLKAAGINPILAAGQAADTGPVVRTEPIQIEKNPPIQDKINMVINMMRQKADISKTFAEEEYIKTKAAQAAFDYQASLESGIPSNASTPGKMVKDATMFLHGLEVKFNNTLESVKKELGGKIFNKTKDDDIKNKVMKNIKKGKINQ